MLNTIISLSIVFFIVSCKPAINIEMRSKIYEVSNAISLISSPLTAQSSSTINLSCPKGTTHYAVSIIQPNVNDTSWIVCPSSSFTINYSLNDGDNDLRFWFKSKFNEVTTISQNLFIRKNSNVKIESTNSSIQNDFISPGSIALSDDRFIVPDAMDSTIALNAGAIHLYNKLGQKIKSIYGENAHDNFGGDSYWCLDSCYGNITKLRYGNFAVTIPQYNSSKGAVFFYDSDGKEVMRVLGSGNDYLVGYNGVFELSNGNVVIVSSQNYGGAGGAVAHTGSVQLINLQSRTIIKTITGERQYDYIGDAGVTPLPNGNFLIHSSRENSGGVSESGSVKLVNGLTGDVITSINGDNPSDQLGSGAKLILKNGNILLGALYDNVGGYANAGSLRLVDSSNGSVIALFGGLFANNYFGQVMYELRNGNFIIISQNQTISGMTFTGQALLVNGETGGIIKSFSGNVANDYFGSGGILELSNGNVAIISPSLRVGGKTSAGSISVIQSDTGDIVYALSGDNSSDKLGAGGVKQLSNGNLVIASPYDVIGGVVNAGSVKLVNSNTGSIIASIDGDNANDGLGLTVHYGITELPNGNVVIGNYNDDIGGKVNPGSVKLVDGSTGAIITTISGDNAGDSFGVVKVVSFPNSNFVLSNFSDDVGGVADVGSVMLINGSTGAIISSIVGDSTNDSMGSGGIIKIDNERFAIISEFDDVGVNSGSITLVNSSTGGVISTFELGIPYDIVSSSIETEFFSDKNILLKVDMFDNSGYVRTMINLIPTN